MAASPQYIVRHRTYLQIIAQTLLKVGFGLLFVLLIGAAILYTRAGGRAYAAPNAQLNFQARLLTSSGAVAPDGTTYAIVFNLYNVSGGGTTQWTETHSNIPIHNGYVSVHLGSITSFPNTINWSEQQWLTMNVNGDGEMSPRLRLTSVPAAFHAMEADGLRDGSSVLGADDFAQLAPSGAQVINSALAALRLNQTGAGGLLQLQNGGTDVFTIAQNGDLVSSGSGTFSGGTLNLGAATQLGGLVMYDGSSNTATVRPNSLGQNTVYRLLDPGVATVDICLSTGNCGGTGDINQNGNSFGTAVIIGTNDAFGLNFETSGTTRAILDTSGNLAFQQASTISTTTGALTLQPVAGSNVNVALSGTGDFAVNTNQFYVDTSSGFVGIGDSAPGARLSIKAASNASTGGFRLVASGNNNIPINFYGLGSNGDNGILQINNATTNTIQLTGSSNANYINSGNFGIGDSSPNALFTVGTNSEFQVNTSGAIAAITGYTQGSGNFAIGGGGNFSVDSATFDVTTAGALSGITTISLSGAISGGTTYTGSGNINTTGGGIQTNSVSRIDNSGNLINIGNITGTGAVTLTSTGGANDLSFTSGSGIINLGATSTLKTTTGLDIDLNSGSDQTLRLLNNGSGVANLNLADGGLQVGGSTVLTSGRALQNLTGINTTGSLVFNSFGGSTGVLTVDGSGNVSVSAASGFEQPLTFSNGLTRTGNAVTFGGTLTGTTALASGGFDLNFTGTGNVAIGTTSAGARLQINTGADATRGLIIRQNSATQSGDLLQLQTSSGGYLGAFQSDGLLNLGAVTGTAQIAGTSTLGDKLALYTNATFGRYGFGVQALTMVAHLGASNGTFAVRVDPGSGQASSGASNVFSVSGTGAGIFANTLAVNGNALTSSASGFTLLATPTTVTAFGAATTLSLGTSAGTTTINGNTLTSTGLTFAGGGATAIQAANNQNLTINTQGSGVLALNTGSTGILTTNASTIQRSGSALTFDVTNAGLSTLHISNSNGSNLANLDVSGGIFAGSGNAFTVNSDGDITSVFTVLNGTSTANGGSGLGTSTSLTLTNAANFDIGNYVQMNSVNCGGTGINPCYAKITNKAGNVLTISPALRWTTGSTVNEYHIPEIGGTNATDTLANRYGRGYFIAGVATGNGTTFYNEDSIITSLTTFDLLNTGVTTLNIGGAATTLNIGNASGTTTIAGTVAFSGNMTAPTTGTAGYLSRSGSTLTPANSGDTFSTSGNLVTTGSGTITSAGLLTVQSGGASVSGGLSLLTGALNLTGGGIANTGSLTGVTGVTFTSGNLALGGGNITGLGTNLTANAGFTIASGGSGDLTLDSASNTIVLEANESVLRRAAAGNYTIELNSSSASALVINNTGSGAASLVLTDGDLSTGSTPTVRLTNAGALQNITTLGLSGAITGATATNTINGLVINGGTLTGITGATFSSGNLALGGGNISGVGTLDITGLATLGAAANVTGDISVTNGKVLIQHASAGASVIVDKTSVGAKIGSLKAGDAKVAFFFDDTGSFSISKDTRANISAGTGAGTDLLAIANTGAITVAGSITGLTTINASGAITAATASNTINGLIVNSGALSGITGFTQTSGNFAISGTGTFETGTGAISLNGATSVTGTNTFTVGTGLASLGGALTATGLATFNGNITLQTGDTFTFNGDAFTDLTSNGLIISSGVLTLDVTTAGTVASTGSNSGLITAADGISLLRGCANNQILKWSTTGPQWNCAADATGISDARLKKNIVSIEENLLDRIKNVQLYKFDYDCAHPAFQTMHCDTDHQEAGVMAQELAQVFPELVTEVNGYYQVRYDALGLYNLKATGELAEKVDNLGANTHTSHSNQVATGGTLRLDNKGVLQNITGFKMISGGASVMGGINNNGGGIINAGTISGATMIDAQSITLDANATDNLLTLRKDDSGVFTIFNNGALELKLDSARAISVKDASGNEIFSIDTLTGAVRIGSGNNNKTVLFKLDERFLPDDPPGVEGASYYNTALDRFRCYTEDQWVDCLPVGDMNDPIALDQVNWQVPNDEQEFKNAPRTIANYTRVHEYRIRMRVTSAAPAGAMCKYQYALSDEGPWKDLAEDANNQWLKIDQAGTLKTEWIKMTKDARTENTVVRVVCKGGNGSQNATFYGVSIQLR